MSRDTEGLSAAAVAGAGLNLTQPSGISYFFIYTFFPWSTCISNDPGPEIFVEVCLNLVYIYMFLFYFENVLH